MILRILRSNIVGYLVLRYGAFGLQFLNSILAASYLSNFNFGIYSFFLLILQYLTYSNLGIANSLNLGLSIKKDKRGLSEQIWQNALGGNGLVGLLILIIGAIMYVVPWPVEDKYSVKTFLWWLLVTAVLVNYNSLYMNLFRVYGRLREINLHQLLIPLSTTVAILLSSRRYMLEWLVIAPVIANILCLAVYITYSPMGLKHLWKWRMGRILIVQGFHLLLYNMSFYFITIGARSVVSVYYSVEELGDYSFSNAIANAAMLAGGALAFLFFPKLVNRFNKATLDECRELLSDVQNVYVLFVNVLMLICVVSLPLLGMLVPDKAHTLFTMIPLFAAQFVLNSNMGYSTMMVARKQEGILTRFGFESVGIVVLTSSLVATSGGDTKLVSLTVVLASLYYTWRVKRFVSAYLNSAIAELEKTIPFIFVVVILVLATWFESYWLTFVALVGYGYFSRKALRMVWTKGVALINNKDALSF